MYISAKVTDFTSFTVTNVLNAISEAKKRNQKVFPVLINSPGGSVINLFQIIDALSESKMDIVTIVNGIAMSAGAVLFASGKRRYMSKNSSIMIHEASSIYWGKVSDVESEANYVKELNSRLFQTLNNTYKGKEKDNFYENLVKENKGADLFIFAEKALEYGLATNIGIPESNEIFNYSPNNFNQVKSEKDIEYITDMERYEVLAEYSELNNLNTSQLSTSIDNKSKDNSKSSKTGGSKRIMDLDDVIASLDAESQKPVLALKKKLTDTENNFNNYKATAENEKNELISNHDKEIKAVNKKYDDFLIDSLIQNKRLTKVEGDKKKKLLASLTGEQKDLYVEDLLESSKTVVPDEIPDDEDKNNIAAKSGHKNPVVASLIEIAAKNGWNLNTADGYMKASRAYSEANKN